MFFLQKVDSDAEWEKHGGKLAQLVCGKASDICFEWDDMVFHSTEWVFLVLQFANAHCTPAVVKMIPSMILEMVLHHVASFHRRQLRPFVQS